jgi:hypothetical protein
MGKLEDPRWIVRPEKIDLGIAHPIMQPIAPLAYTNPAAAHWQDAGLQLYLREMAGHLEANFGGEPRSCGGCVWHA